MALALFISDLHLQSNHPKTTARFFSFMKTYARTTQQLYLLGDLFEYWAGDDDLDASAYHRNIAEAIAEVSHAGVQVFWIAGNRDFLVGDMFVQKTGITRLPDPSVITLAGCRIAIAHGDAQCTEDLPYMAFRSQVRQPNWQQAFLEKPLAERKAIIESLRQHSREGARLDSTTDVAESAIMALFKDTRANTLIHGHTHRPGIHKIETPQGLCTRYVLPDWEYDTSPERGGWIAVDHYAHITCVDGKRQP